MKRSHVRIMAVESSASCLKATASTFSHPINLDQRRVIECAEFTRNKLPQRTFLSWALLVGALVFAFGLAPRPAAAATHVVTTTDDSGSGSLREGLAIANHGDTIDLGGGVGRAAGR